MINSEMNKKILIPRTIINTEGRLTYNDNLHAWNLLRLKKEITDEFPQLKEKRSKFSYKMSFHRNHEELVKTIKELKDDQVMPVLLWFGRDK